MATWVLRATIIAGCATALAGCSLGGQPGALEQFGSTSWGWQARSRNYVMRDGRGRANPPATWFWLAGDNSSAILKKSLYLSAGLAALADELDDQEDPPGAGASATKRHRSGPLPGFWGTVRRDVEEMPSQLWEDGKAVYTSPEKLVVFGLTYGGSLAVQQSGVDDTVEDHFSGHRTFKNNWRDGFAAVGNPGTHFGLAGLWYLIGQQKMDEKTYEVGKTLFSALAINGLTTMAGQAASWDRSPNGEWGTFPSGHTSSSFTFASVMHEAYGPWVGAPLYALSALVGYERLESGEHYLSDVIMGAVMGLVIGHTVAGEHKLEFLGGRIAPFVDPYTQTSGLAWVKSFK